LANNAGIQRYGSATTVTEEEWDEVLNVNLKSAFLMSKYAIPEMIKRGGGAIVMTGSVQSLTA
jgi:NAD(P)-dependent dehydrogenase (short-subunit alcohol dehydrogenase family)